MREGKERGEAFTENVIHNNVSWGEYAKGEMGVDVRKRIPKGTRGNHTKRRTKSRQYGEKNPTGGFRSIVLVEPCGTGNLPMSRRVLTDSSNQLMGGENRCLTNGEVTKKEGDTKGKKKPTKKTTSPAEPVNN